MKQNNQKFTTSQFAKLHNINKRTLHYYDDIGLFSPNIRGDNGYRYYDVSQSVDFEYIRMLKELNMSIEEIASYRQNPSAEKFLEIVNIKEKEVEMQIKKLNNIKNFLQDTQKKINFCQSLDNQCIRIEKCTSEKILILPYSFADDDVVKAFDYIKDTWSIEQIRMGLGSILSLENVYNKDFENYQGIYTVALDDVAYDSCFIKPEGLYLCGYQKGTWDKLPEIYDNMLDYAHTHQLKLTGSAYETGLNEFAISKPEDYITKVMIKIDDN